MPVVKYSLEEIRKHIESAGVVGAYYPLSQSQSLLAIAKILYNKQF